MNVQGMPWYQSKKMIKSKKNLVDLNLLPRERRAIILGAYKAYLPVFLGILGGFVVAYLLFLLWAVYLV